MTDVEIVARWFFEEGVDIEKATDLLRALTANGRAKIVRREPTKAMTTSFDYVYAVDSWRSMYDAAPAFSDQDETVPVKTPERSS
jgi:hypothetical protein